MSIEALQFKSGNPGAVQYGNFINYYQFHPPEERISALPKDIWLKTITEIPENKDSGEYVYTVLDIGCNAGNLTTYLYNFLATVLPSYCKIKVLAIDIDSVLIQRAKELFPLENISFMQCDCTKPEFQERTHNFLQRYTKQMFDVIFCFSTTMWIHLNTGDEGLQTFLKDISIITNLLVIEPQPWKCYKNAVKRMKNEITFPHINNLEMSHQVVHNIITFIQKLNMTIIYECAKTKWARTIYCCFRQSEI